MTAAGAALLSLTLVGRVVAAQVVPAANVPGAVRQSLVTRYPGIQTAAWTFKADRTYVAAFSRGGSNVRIIFKPSGEWLETATEIGAISLPEPVRKTIVSGYRGYRFVETRRLERATAPKQLFEVHLEKSGEQLTVQFDASGKRFSSRSIAPPVQSEVPLTGIWRGASTCLASIPDCHGEPLVYHITAVANDTTGFDLETDRDISGREELIARLPCSFDRRRAALYCSTTQGTWQFALQHDSLVGSYSYKDGTPVSRVVVRRQP